MSSEKHWVINFCKQLQLSTYFLRYETLKMYGVSLSTDHKLSSPWLPTFAAWQVLVWSALLLLSLSWCSQCLQKWGRGEKQDTANESQWWQQMIGESPRRDEEMNLFLKFSFVEAHLYNTRINKRGIIAIMIVRYLLCSCEIWLEFCDHPYADWLRASTNTIHVGSWDIHRRITSSFLALSPWFIILNVI